MLKSRRKFTLVDFHAISLQFYGGQMTRESDQHSRLLAAAFHFIVLTSVLVLLSMPVLPTTDGPIHRYYVGVLHDVLSHNGSVYDQAYQIRYPISPYATQYLVELALTDILKISAAEKIFAILALLTTAYGFRSAARALGKSGDAIALSVSCLLLPWSLWMGFFNYTLAVGLSLAALAFWLHARAGQKKFWLLFGGLCLLIEVTHPIPLLMLLFAILLDLAIATVRERRVRAHWDAIGAFVFVIFLSAYPLFISATSHTRTSIQDYGFHLRRIARQLLLFGLSPYAVGSRDILPNFYRLSIYAVAVMAIYLGWMSWKQAFRQSSLEFVNLMLPVGALLGLVILVMPDGVSGSFFFATRLITFVWIAFLLSASNVDFRSVRLLPVWIVGTASMFCIGILAAMTFIFPVAKKIAVIETEKIPADSAGLVIDPSQDLQVKPRSPLEFTPYHWAGAIPFVESHQLLLNSPWLEQAILPLAFRNGSLLLNAQVAKEDASKIGSHDGTVKWLTAPSLQGLLRDSDVIIYRTPMPGSSLSDQIGIANASLFTCIPRSWYSKCLQISGAKGP